MGPVVLVARPLQKPAKVPRVIFVEIRWREVKAAAEPAREPWVRGVGAIVHLKVAVV